MSLAALLLSATAAQADLRTGRRGPVKVLRPPGGNRGDFLDYVAVTPDGGARRVLWRAPAYNLALHISCRNTRLPGWAFLSSSWDGIGQRPAPTPFENEVFALSLSSSAAAPVVRRLAHTRMNERADYFDEPHATVRQGGRMVLFASNFGRFVTDESYDDTYAIDLR